jgi:hypothetical protein
LTLLGFAVGGGQLRAEEVEVTAVRFGAVRPANNPADTWLEAAVSLNVTPPPAALGRAVGRVRVTLAVGWEVPAPVGNTRRTDYYRAEAECVALDSGRTDVRFYFPPELVKRDQLRGNPPLWTVDVAVAGRALPAARPTSATALTELAARRAFQAAVAAAAAANDGLLQPQYFTPFALEYPRATPTFVRREAAATPPARAGP